MSEKEYAVAFTAKERAELVELPDEGKPLGAEEITGKTLASLISPGTELNSAYLGSNFPAYPGYAAVFAVDAVGEAVTDIDPGDICFCTGPHGMGGHRSRQRCPRTAAIPVPQGLAPEDAAHARLMGVTMSTLTTTAARPPEKVLITGLGPIGHLGAQTFRACGYEVIGVDPVESRRELAKARGIETVLPAVPIDDEATKGKVAMAIDCSGHEQAVLDACRVVMKKGEVVLTGVPWRRRTEVYAFDVFHAVYRGYLTLRSGWEWEVPRHGEDFRHGSVFGSLAAALKWLAQGRVNTEGLYRKVKPREAQAVYQELLKGASPTLSVVFDWT